MQPPPQVEAQAPRCAELSEQGLLCHDSWCWELQGQQGNDLLAATSTGKEVWAVGAAGTLLRWDGKRWSREPSGTSVTLVDVDHSGDEVWAVGAEGTILRRTRGQWHAESSPSPVDVHRVEVAAPGDAWIAVAGGVARYHQGAWSWVLRAAGDYDLWSSGPDDVWILGERKAYRWDGSGLHEMETPFFRGRFGGTERGRPFVASEHEVYQWTGEAFEQRFAIPNSTFTVEALAQHDGDLWVFANRGGGGSGWDDGRLVVRWDGTTAHEVWSESFPASSQWSSGMPRALALLDGGGAFLMGERGRTLRWDGSSWFEPPRAPGDIDVLLPFDTGGYWALHWTRGPWISGLQWDGTSAWRPLEQVGGFTSGRLTGTGPEDIWVLIGRLSRWDGSTWHGYDDVGVLRDVYSVTRDEVWAVGDGGRAVHLQGDAWTEAPTGTTGDLQALWASGPKDVWAGGATLIHWNGEAWSPAPGIDATEDLRITQLSGSGPGEAWALGTRLHRWDGKAWRDVAPPRGNERCWELWSAGPAATFATCEKGFYRWDGRGWTALPFHGRPGAFAGKAKRGYMAYGDALLRYCRE
ncbi:WD40/YVTN/BNR-like repeat-containing protein [Pyxidicoccus xibeiensis]|uniref:WD40/YVTN/BNR-like repeat-containing protein n=1 Tax=Pyxidicoccus xibeiensis TaxID=2906759 RepID=UPI0020A7E5D9|nr:hypothetical protein [Pyxidicoccus xibeiensis]MCP3140387.1 hypothetical protein [Pyxidicoccus xibeiensis]